MLDIAFPCSFLHLLLYSLEVAYKTYLFLAKSRAENWSSYEKFPLQILLWASMSLPLPLPFKLSSLLLPVCLSQMSAKPLFSLLAWIQIAVAGREVELGLAV